MGVLVIEERVQVSLQKVKNLGSLERKRVSHSSQCGVNPGVSKVFLYRQTVINISGFEGQESKSMILLGTFIKKERDLTEVFDRFQNMK